MNYIIIAGHLGADPEVRFTSTGKKVTAMRVATRSRRGNTDETIWWRVSIWGDQFDKMIPFFKKGSAIIVCGDLQKPEIFTDRDGKPQISMNITASQIQFSPFGKPDRPAQENASESSIAAALEMQRDHSPSACAGSGIQSGKASSGGNEAYDDEVPF
jgi:single-strand DNA-binding protein